MLLQVLFFYLGIEKVVSYPESGVHTSLKHRQKIEPKQWTLVQGWGNNEYTGSFIQDFRIIRTSEFVTPRSGLYFVSLHLYFQTGSKQSTVNITLNNSKTFVTKYNSLKTQLDLHIYEILSADVETSVSIFLYIQEANILMTGTSISIQFINSFKNSLGFISSPSTQRLNRNEKPQHLLNWNTDFNLVNGFSNSIGVFTPLVDGYYILVLKFLMAHITGIFNVYLVHNAVRHTIIQRQYATTGKHTHDTVFYTDIRKLRRNDNVQLLIYTRNKGGTIIDSSKFSVVYLKSANKKIFYNQHVHSKEMITRNNEWYRVINWLPLATFLKEIQINSNGYYYVIIHLDVKSSNLESILVRLLINNIPQITMEQTGYEGVHRFVLSGVFFIKVQESISCEIRTVAGDVILDSSFFTIATVTFLNYTSLYGIKTTTNVSSTNEQDEDASLMMKNFDKSLFPGVLLEPESLSNPLFSITDQPNEYLISIKYDGNYFITLNLCPKNGSIVEVNFALLHQRGSGNWNIVEQFHTSGTQCVFFTNVLTLHKNDQLALLQHLKTLCDECLDTSLAILFLQPTENSIGASFFINDSHTSKVHAVSGYIGSNAINSIYKGVTATDKETLTAQATGVYLISLNLAISLPVPDNVYTIKINVGLKSNGQRRMTTILEIKKSVLDQPKLYFYDSFIYFLKKGQEISVKITYLERRPFTVKTITGDFSVLLIRKNKTSFITRDADFTNELSGGGFINWKSNFFEKDYYFIVLIDIRAQTTIQALVSTIVNGKVIVDKPGRHYIKMNLQINKKPLHHINTKYENFSTTHDVSMTLSGLVTLEQEDFVYVYMYLSPGIKFKLSKQTKIYIAVLKETFQHVKSLKSLQSDSIHTNYDKVISSADASRDLLIDKSGIYAIIIQLYDEPKIQKRRKKRETPNDNTTTTATNTTSNPIQQVYTYNDKISSVKTRYSSDSSGITKRSFTGDTVTTNNDMKAPAQLTTLPSAAPFRSAIPIKSSHESETFNKIIIHEVGKASTEDIDITKLHRMIDEIWTNSIFNLSCVKCNHEIKVLTYLHSGKSMAISSSRYNVGLKLLSEEETKYFDFKITEDQLICQDDKSIDYVRRESKGSKNYFYQAPEYELVYIYATFVVNDIEKQSTVWLVTDSDIDAALMLHRTDVSETRSLYQIDHKLYLRRNAIVQIMVKCQNYTIELIKGSKLSIYKLESVISDYQDDIPMFNVQPFPKLNELPNPITYTCEVTDEKLNENIYWNRIDIYNGEESKRIASGRSISFVGVPEETGHYFCQVEFMNSTAESNVITFKISDDDECVLMKYTNNTVIEPCDTSSECINTIGSYYCVCNEGFTGDGFNCKDIDECADSPCGNFSVCINYPGGFKCECQSGYRGMEGENCTDINECVENGEDFCERELSSDKALCTNFPGSYECYCDDGYEKKSGTCLDINECESDPADYPCSDQATCFNTQGSFYCRCDKGWFGNGTFCEDVNECATSTLSNCTGNSTCVNNFGSYRCICNRGYKGDGFIKCTALGCFPPPWCSGQYSASWWARKPYIENGSREDEAYGLFKDIISLIITDICNNCSQIVFKPPLNGSTSVEQKVEENITDFACPLYGSKEQEKFRGFPFIPLVEAPGVAFFVKELERENNPLLGSLAGSWPILVITLLLASLSGVIIWFLDTVRNPNEFPHSFLEGSWEGFWWAFITMTTVGYGDKAPRSFLARVFGIVWILIGLVIISTFTATITTVLTASSLSNDVKLYGTKVGALANSEEFRLGVKRNADVIGYRTVPEIINALNEGEIQGALLDTYIAGEFQESLNEYKLQEILEHIFVYGLTLARDAENLESHFRSYIERKQSSIYSIISQVVKPLKENKATKENGGNTATLFDAKSPFFVQLLVGGFVILFALLFVGFLWDWLYWRNKNQKAKKIINGALAPEVLQVSWETCDIIEHQKRSFKKEIKDLKEQILGFSELWLTRLNDMENKHEEQLTKVQKWLGKSNLLSTIRHYPTTNSSFSDTIAMKENKKDFVKLYQTQKEGESLLRQNYKS